ncbi:DUF3147 family protein [Streptosporangium amethystogenes subsp. fukuiense]|uniref:DUF3147 family protein n=1 Tax=Streptosporangium amethystogenes subsp. fukuiense TaxID=698418 RepID=A0ABW2SW25_9ACTN
MSAPRRMRIQPSKLRRVTLPGMALRFAFGAAVSVAAGLVGNHWGPVTGGVFLAFPAVLAATLTLIQDEEHSRIPASNDARGAVLGAVGMIAFALCVWALATRIPTLVAMGIALVAWAIVAAVLYLLIWGVRRSR